MSARTLSGVEDRLLTVGEVAEAAGVTESTIRAYKARGQMPAPSVVYGRTPLWRESAVNEWLAERRP